MSKNSSYSGDFRSIATKGALTIGLAQVWRIVVTFVSGVIFVRLLTPADFGLFAAVGACLAFVTMIQQLGLSQATIQRADVSHSQMSALFWISAGASILLALVVVIAAPAIAAFFGDDRLTDLAMASSIGIVLGGIQSQPQAFITRQLRFRTLAIIDVLTVTIGAPVGIAIAWFTASYWALYAAAITNALVGTTACLALSRWRPGRPSFEGQFKEIFNFGAGITGFNIVNYFARNADNLLIGRYYGSDQLGIYDRAYRLLLFPLQQLSWPLGRVMFPLLSRLLSDSDRYRKAYTECISLLMTATQPALVFAIVFADDVFRLLFGPKWMEATPIFRWLGLFGLVQVVMTTTGWLFQSQGRGGDYLKLGVINSIITVASFIIGLPWGTTKVAMAYTLSGYALRIPISLWALGRRGAITTGIFIHATFPHAIATAACFAVLTALSPILTPLGWTLLFVLLSASYVVYCIMLLAFSEKRVLLTKVLNLFLQILFVRKKAKGNA